MSERVEGTVRNALMLYEDCMREEYKNCPVVLASILKDIQQTKDELKLN